MRETRVVLLTGNGHRHRAAARHMAKRLNVIGIISETKAQAISAPELLSKDDHATIAMHFSERDRVERNLLGSKATFPDTDVLEIPHGRINTPECCEWVSKRNPDVVVLYGTSLIKPPLLELYAGRMVNLHLGLSPYYRGSGTNFWPLVNREPECVGATIHLAVAKVNSGPVLAQVRPLAETTDRGHELGTKSLIAALDLLPEVLLSYHGGISRPAQQNLSLGKVYRLSDFTAQAVRDMWANFDQGMMQEYLSDLEARQTKYPIVEWAGATV